jgi:hypothetical protein
MFRRLKYILSSISVAAITAGILFFPTQVLAGVTNQSIIAPLFAKPGAFWDDIRAAGSSSVPFVVASVNNGPGVKADPVYAAAIAKNSTAQIRTLGYVQTNYQTRNFKDAFNDVDNWYKFYPQTSGIYIDLLKEGAQDEVCYVSALYTHIKNTHPNDVVILSPGSHISTAYEPYGDIFVNANTDYQTYQNWRVQFKGFEDKTQYQNRFLHMVYGITADQYSNAFTLTRNNNAGWTYLTDKTNPTPYTATPSFWQNEGSDIGALPASSIPNRGRTSLPRGCISLSSSADSTIDTRTAKQSTTTSTVTVNNTSAGFDSEPTTTMKFLNLPKGTNFTGMAAQGWQCDPDTKSCSYGSTIPITSSPPTIATSLTTDCTYTGGDATLRLTNYTGNQWDLRVPIKAPFGCDASTAASKLNSDSSGLISALTTQSVETTPEITPLGGTANKQDDHKAATPKKAASAVKLVAVLIIVIVIIGVGIWLALYLRKRNRYSVRL